MANKSSFFLTGANARIIINNTTVAYATDISYNVHVEHAEPRVLGRFEVETIQPLAYNVEGQLSIIKYARGLKSYLKERAPDNASDNGSGVGSLRSGSALGAVGSALGLPTTDGQFDGGADEAFVPGRFFQSKMFNIEIRQKIPIVDTGTITSETIRRLGLENLDDALVRDVVRPSDNETTIVFLRDCRFTDLGFAMTKRGVAVQTLRFKARYADDDTFIAAKSGVGQELT